MRNFNTKTFETGVTIKQNYCAMAGEYRVICTNIV